MNLLLPMTIAGLLVTGMGLALLGSVKVSLARKLNIDEAKVGGLVSLFGFTMIPVILTAGFLTDLIGRQAVLVAGGVLMTVSLIVLARAKTYRGALLAVLLMSAAWSAQVNVINVLTPLAFEGSAAFAMNLGNVFFGMGAFLTPLAIVVLLKKSGLSGALYLLAGVVLVSVLLSVSVDFSALANSTGQAEQTTDSHAEIPGTGTLLSDPVMWLCALSLFFYGPIEAAVAAWSTTLLGDQGVSEGTAAGLLSGFWLAFMSSRLITAFTIPVGAETNLILGMGLLSIGVLAGIAFCSNKSITIGLVIAAGLVFGPIFPTIMAVLLGHFEPVVHGRAVGLLFAIGGIGWTTIPMLIGAYANRTSVQRSYLVAAASAVGLCVIATALKFYTAT
jgi:fucose permease